MRPRDQRAARIVRALVALQFSRMYKPLRMTVVTIIVLSAIDVAKKGLSIDTTVPWALGGLMMAPLIPCFLLIKERGDGSLRYLASLPVDEELHGIARSTAAFLLSVLPAGLSAYALYVHVPGVTPVAMVLTAIVFALALTAVSVCILAIQLKREMGEGFVLVFWIFPAAALAGYVIEFAAGRGWLAWGRAVLSSPAGLMGISAVLWAALAVAGVMAARSIGRTTVHYRGEPAKE